MEATEEHHTIGRRLREVRYWRRKSLRVVAELAGISEGYLSKLERGHALVERRSLILALAYALEIAPSELTRLPVPAPGNGHTDSAIEQVRRALVAVDLGQPGGQVLPVEELWGRVTRLQEARRLCRFADVAGDLPGLIRDVHTTLAAGRKVADLLPLISLLHVQVTTMWLKDAGAPVDLLLHTDALARNAAAEDGSHTMLGLAAFGTVYALLAAGMPDLAQAELDSVTLPATTPANAGLVSVLTMTNAAVAVMDKRPDDVAAPLAEAAELTRRFGDDKSEGDPFGFGFGPASLDARRVAFALEAEEPDRAVNTARDVQPKRLPFITRQAGFWVDVGRAAAQLRNQREDAVRAFCTAERLFPTRVYRDPFARDTVTDLLGHARRDAGGRELRALAYRMGVAG